MPGTYDFSIESMVSLPALNENPELLVQKFEENRDLCLISRDQPCGVLVSFERYCSLREAAEILDMTLQDRQGEQGTEPVKIGQYIRQTMETLFQEHRLTEQELGHLCNPEYSRRVLRSSYPVLKEVPARCQGDPAVLHEYCVDQHNYLRYYARVFSAYGKCYVLCNNWREMPHRAAFESWVASIQR